jgi:hypothetical protein
VVESQVIRIFRFRPALPAFDANLRTEMIPELRRKRGLVEVWVGRRGPDETGPRAIVSVWASAEAMIEAVGESFDRPVFFPEYLDQSTDRSLEWCPVTFGFASDDPQPPTILRVAEGSVRLGELEAYVADVRQGTQTDAEAGHGPRALYLAARPPTDFIAASVWRDWPTVERATGGTVVHPEVTRQSHRLTAWNVAHYEIVPLETEPQRRGVESLAADAAADAA